MDELVYTEERRFIVKWQVTSTYREIIDESYGISMYVIHRRLIKRRYGHVS